MRRRLAWTITSSDSSQQRAQTFEAGWGRRKNVTAAGVVLAVLDDRNAFAPTGHIRVREKNELGEAPRRPAAVSGDGSPVIPARRCGPIARSIHGSVSVEPVRKID
jgi:hypothetical protein